MPNLLIYIGFYEAQVALGVLFLDEMLEYSRNVLEALRQPLEDGVATVSRLRARAQYQSSFILVASMNPSPCGYYGSSVKSCRCGSHEIRKYLDRISGPLLGRGRAVSHD